MQIRIWGTPQENQDMIYILQKELQDKIKIISSPYMSKNNSTQRVYMEIDLENKNYRKISVPNRNSQTENNTFNEIAFFEEMKKGIDRDS